MESLSQLIKNLDIAQLIAIGSMIWFFYSRLGSKMDKIDREWKEESKKMDQRVTESNKRMDGVYNILLRKLETKTDP